MVQKKQLLMYWRKQGRHEHAIIPGRIVGRRIRRPARKGGQKISVLQRFNPDIHIPATQEDGKRIEQALWEGWELTVEAGTGTVWIGSREEKIGACVKK